MTTPPKAFVSDPQQATRVIAFGDDLRIHVSGPQTGGQFSIIEQSYALSTWGWEHRHRSEDHYVQITQGEMEFDLDGATYTCGTGQAIFVPRNTWHRFRTTSPEAATMLFFNFPGGLEEMFLAVADAEAHGTTDEQQLLRIVARYGVDVRKSE